eukprot:scaffold287079_cov67-Attheya_sp.AAC.2
MTTNNNTPTANPHAILPLSSDFCSSRATERERGGRREKARATAATTHHREFVCSFKRTVHQSINRESTHQSKQAREDGERQ